MKLILYILLSLNICTVHCAEKEKPIIACSTELITEKATTSAIVTKALTKAPALFLSRPTTLLKMGWHQKDIVKKGEEIAKSTPGTANVIKKLLQYLEQQNYGKFTQDDIDAFTSIAIQADKKKEGIAFLNKLKKQGFKVVAATNQDSLQYKKYTEHLKKDHDIDLALLFDAAITVPYLDVKMEDDKPFCKHSQEEQWYLCAKPKPHHDYLRTVTTISKIVAPLSNEVVLSWTMPDQSDESAPTITEVPQFPVSIDDMTIHHTCCDISALEDLLEEKYDYSK